MNPILATDSYKASHWLQYPKDTRAIFSYIEARSGDFTVFFGLQAIIKKYLANPVTRADVEQAACFYQRHGVPFNYEGWMRIVTKHKGYLPVKIRAVPEGLPIPTKNVLATVESTDPELSWVGSYIEGLLLRVWYPATVATRSFMAKQVIADYMDETSESRAGLEFKLHDFGARGVSSGESAEIGGMAHLVNFAGSDTVEGIVGAMEYYGKGIEDGLPPAFSIPAAEHSTITSWGRENEVEAYRNIIETYGGKYPFIAVVSDSYDIFNACDRLWGEELKQAVIDSGSTLVVRPDSGNPVTVVCEVARILDARFGSTINSKGYRVLNNVRIIQGDGLDGPNEIKAILEALKGIGYSADNIAFGMGGGLLQKCNRDTYGFAMKCSAALIDGKWRDVFKDPATSADKKSKKGRLTLLQDMHDGSYMTMTEQEAKGWSDYPRVEVLQTVYEDGKVFISDSLDTVRGRTGLWG